MALYYVHSLNWLHNKINTYDVPTYQDKFNGNTLTIIDNWMLEQSQMAFLYGVASSEDKTVND